MLRQPCLIAVLVLSFLVWPESTVLAAPDAVVDAASKVTAVTVFRDRARVTRSATIELPAGERTVRFKGLPSVLEPDTARVSGQGSAGIVIRSLEIRRDVAVETPGPEVARLQSEIETLEREQALRQERVRSVDFLRDLLTQFRGALAGGAADAGPAAGRDPDPLRVDLDLWRQGYGFLSERLDAIAAEKRTLEESLLQGGREIGFRKAAIAASPSGGPGTTWIADVLLSSRREGSATLSLNYLSPEAAWSPVYDARLLPAEGRLTLSAFGQILQHTGEDWRSVDITLSSTRPLAALDLPRLASLYVRGQAPRRALNEKVRVEGESAEMSSEFTDSLPVLGHNYQDVLTLSLGAFDGDGAGFQTIHGARDTDVVSPLVSAKAELETRSAGVVFRLPGRVDIPSDGQSHRHLIVERDLKAAVEYRSAPALDRSVYLVARATVPADLTLLPGMVQHFVEEDLVGRSSLQGLPGGSPLDLGFGPEERLVVERREEEKRSPKSGDDVELRRRFLTTFRNQLERPVTVQITERLPLSGTSTIRVELDDKQTLEGGLEDDKDRGVYRWSVTIAPAASKDLAFAYSVRAPRNLHLELASALR